MTTLQAIKELIRTGKPEEALAALASWVKAHRSSYEDEVINLTSQWNRLTQEQRKGIVDYSTYTHRENLLVNSLLGFIKKLESEGELTPSTSVALQHYHQYTCDRVDQIGTFTTNRLEQQRNIQFYYIYGLDVHAHEGLFNRLAYELYGVFQDLVNPKMGDALPPVQVTFTPDLSASLDVYLINILKSLFAAFQVQPNEKEPLLKQRLSDLVAHSPALKSLSSKDYVCVLISINPYDWDAEMVPAAARWFIDEFCSCSLPEDCPTFLFFLGLEYEEEEEAVREEVRQVVQDSKRITALPELNMVTYRDVSRWLEKYRSIQPFAHRRKQLREQYFGKDKSQLFYMEDVQIKLAQIIAAFNENRLQ